MTAFDTIESLAIKPASLSEIQSPIYDDSLKLADLLEPRKDATNSLVVSGVLPELELIISETGIDKDPVEHSIRELQLQSEKLKTLTEKPSLELERGKLASNLKDAGISGVSIEKLEAELKPRHISNDTTSDIYRSLNKILEVEPQLLKKDLRTLLVKDFLQELS